MLTEQQVEFKNKLDNHIVQFAFEYANPETWDNVTDSYYELLNSDVTVQSFEVLCSEKNNRDLAGQNQIRVDVAARLIGETQSTHYVVLFGRKVDEQSNFDRCRRSSFRLGHSL